MCIYAVVDGACWSDHAANQRWQDSGAAWCDGPGWNSNSVIYVNSAIEVHVDMVAPGSRSVVLNAAATINVEADCPYGLTVSGEGSLGQVCIADGLTLTGSLEVDGCDCYTESVTFNGGGLFSAGTADCSIALGATPSDEIVFQNGATFSTSSANNIYTTLTGVVTAKTGCAWTMTNDAPLAINGEWILHVFPTLAGSLASPTVNMSGIIRAYTSIYMSSWNVVLGGTPIMYLGNIYAGATIGFFGAGTSTYLQVIPDPLIIPGDSDVKNGVSYNGGLSTGTYKSASGILQVGA